MTKVTMMHPAHASHRLLTIACHRLAWRKPWHSTVLPDQFFQNLASKIFYQINQRRKCISTRNWANLSLFVVSHTSRWAALAAHSVVWSPNHLRIDPKNTNIIRSWVQIYSIKKWKLAVHSQVSRMNSLVQIESKSQVTAQEHMASSSPIKQSTTSAKQWQEINWLRFQRTTHSWSPRVSSKRPNSSWDRRSTKLTGKKKAACRPCSQGSQNTLHRLRSKSLEQPTGYTKIPKSRTSSTSDSRPRKLKRSRLHSASVWNKS